MCFESVLDMVVEILNIVVKFVFIVGLNFWIVKVIDVFEVLVIVSGYVVVVMLLGKGYFWEIYLYFVGIYWGVVSILYVLEIVEFVDIYVFVGLIFNDYRWVCFVY